MPPPSISGAPSEISPVRRSPLRRGAKERRTGGEKSPTQSPGLTGLSNYLLRRDAERRAAKIYTLELPLPPSVNRFKHTKRGRPLGNKSPNVVAWRKEADFALWQQKPLPSIKGPLRAHIVWPVEEFRLFDADNRVKVLLDFLQSRQIIGNDGDCVGPDPEFGPEAKKGWCFIELWSVPDPRGT